VGRAELRLRDGDGKDRRQSEQRGGCRDQQRRADTSEAVAKCEPYGDGEHDQGVERVQDSARDDDSVGVKVWVPEKNPADQECAESGHDRVHGVDRPQWSGSASNDQHPGDQQRIGKKAGYQQEDAGTPTGQVQLAGGDPVAKTTTAPAAIRTQPVRVRRGTQRRAMTVAPVAVAPTAHSQIGMPVTVISSHATHTIFGFGSEAFA
jgi:hypothetical protein